MSVVLEVGRRNSVIVIADSIGCLAKRRCVIVSTTCRRIERRVIVVNAMSVRDWVCMRSR
jgi:hypothetical protein